MYRVHNSTVSKQLRYSLTRESVPQLVSRDKAPCTVAECRLIGVQCRNSMKKYKYGKRKIMMTKNCRYATINSKHYISVNTTPQQIFIGAYHFEEGRPLRIFRQRHGNFQCFMLPVNSRKIEMSDVKTLREKRVVGILPAFI